MIKCDICSQHKKYWRKEYPNGKIEFGVSCINNECKRFDSKIVDLSEANEVEIDFLEYLQRCYLENSTAI